MHFLYYYYFLRVAWAKLTLKPFKLTFFVSNLRVLGFYQTLNRLRLLVDKIAAIRDYLVPTCEVEVLRFYYMLLWLKSLILGRAN